MIGLVCKTVGTGIAYAYVNHPDKFDMVLRAAPEVYSASKKALTVSASSVVSGYKYISRRKLKKKVDT
jgi:hypothetical protein